MSRNQRFPLLCALLWVITAPGCGDDDGPEQVDTDAPATAAVDGATGVTDAPQAADAPAADPDAPVTIDSGEGPVDAGGVDGKPAGDTCGGCHPGDFCETPGGDCEAVGECILRPTDCGVDDAPVCGCDDVTYLNDCVRQMAGVGQSHRGACEVICVLFPPLGCCFSDGHCDATGGGLCYGGDCGAGIAGRCEPKPEPGTCWGDRDCVLGETCKGADICPCGTDCLVPDSPGLCESVGCAIEPPDPTCCYDDEDCPDPSNRCYDNKCTADGAGRCMPKVSDGGCWNDGDCAPDQFCSEPFICPCGEDCPSGDKEGTCMGLS